VFGLQSVCSDGSSLRRDRAAPPRVAYECERAGCLAHAPSTRPRRRPRVKRAASQAVGYSRDELPTEQSASPWLQRLHPAGAAVHARRGALTPGIVRLRRPFRRCVAPQGNGAGGAPRAGARVRRSCAGDASGAIRPPATHGHNGVGRVRSLVCASISAFLSSGGPGLTARGIRSSPDPVTCRACFVTISIECDGRSPNVDPPSRVLTG
jgi:hypothetical protein